MDTTPALEKQAGTKSCRLDVKDHVNANLRHLVTVLIAVSFGVSGCDGGGLSSSSEKPLITIADLTGLSRARAIALIDELDLDIRTVRVDREEVESQTASPGAVAGTRLAGDVVLRQEPPPGTQVTPGATVTLYVPYSRALRPQERRFRLLTHCGLSFPVEFGQRSWLPVDPKLRRTINPPSGFSSNGFYDRGTMRRVDKDTLVYTSSSGIEVVYAPTNKVSTGCD